MTAYDPSEWTDFFVAAAGASAALAGLVFVAVSINIDRILKLAGVPERALETVLTLLGVVLISLLMLMPGAENEVLGSVVIGLVVILAGVVAQIRKQGRRQGRKEGKPQDDDGGSHVSLQALRVMACGPVAIAGISLIAEAGGGLYWLAAGLLMATLAAVNNAWVLLVEILR